MRRVRETGHEWIYREYFPKIGHLVNGTVKELSGTDRIVSLEDGVDALLPRREQAEIERLIKGERIRAVITKVTRDAHFPQDAVELSRRSSLFLQCLFEREVDEISDSKVVIKAVGRAMLVDAGRLR